MFICKNINNLLSVFIHLKLLRFWDNITTLPWFSYSTVIIKTYCYYQDITFRTMSFISSRRISFIISRRIVIISSRFPSKYIFSKRLFLLIVASNIPLASCQLNKSDHTYPKWNQMCGFYISIPCVDWNRYQLIATLIH